MIRKASAIATSLLGIALAGCGGGKKYAQPTVTPDGGADASGGSDAAGGGDTGGRPAPMAGTGSHQVISGLAFLVGNGPDSCTTQLPASGDRWCGVVVPSRLIGQAQFDLIVVNVTKAAAGTNIVCDGSQPDACLRLTSDPLIDQNLGISVHAFTGDTLIYYESTSQTAFAWRPGMNGGRAVTPANTALFCLGHATTDAVYCFVNQQQDAAGNISADLLAGTMPAAGAVLPKIDTVLAVLATDDPNAPGHFSAMLSPAGDTIAWTARPTAAGAETLNAQRLGDATSRRMVASDVSQVTISRDGTRYYWLKTFNYSATAPAGTLQRAAFPDGASPTDLSTTVGEYVQAGARGLIFTRAIANGRGTLQSIADRDAPTAVTLDTAVGARIASSATGNRIAYYKSLTTAVTSGGSLNLFDLWAAGVDLTTPCHLTASATALPEAFFSDTGQLVGHISVSVQNGVIAGLNGTYTKLADCSHQPFGQSLFAATAVGDEGYVYGDQTVDFTDVTLQYATTTNNTLGTGTVIQTRADATFAVLPPALPVVVYTVNANTGQDGLYVSGTLPFSTTQPHDAGSTD